MVTSRDQIRSVEPLFKLSLTHAQMKVAVRIFTDLLEKPKFSYDDAVAQIETLDFRNCLRTNRRGRKS